MVIQAQTKTTQLLTVRRFATVASPMAVFAMFSLTSTPKQETMSAHSMLIATLLTTQLGRLLRMEPSARLTQALMTQPRQLMSTS